jgi:uncharacterized protein (TIGR03790 family)
MNKCAAACVAICLGWPAAAVFAQSAENVAVIVNDASPDSKRIADHYARVRGLPAENVIHLSTSTADNIARAMYVSDIETPIAAAIRRHNLHDRVLYLVLTKGVPLRIDGTPGQDGTVASVDSELTLLYRRMAGGTAPIRGRVPNPYFLSTTPVADAVPFTHRAHDIYLVTRLTGFTADDAIALIDRAQRPRADGRFVLDQRAGIFNNPLADRQLADAHARLTQAGLGDRVTLESTTNPARDIDNVVGYYSWGSNDPENRGRRTGMRFAPGALAAMFVSGDARTFDAPPANWRPSGDVRNKASWFRGSPQSLTGDLIQEGVTGAAGHVAEPYLQSAVHPEILFPAYAAGFNLVEAFYLALPDLGWQSVIVGDPLCAPFPRRAVTATDVTPSTDPATELPEFFARRRTEVLSAQFKTTPPTAVQLLIRAEGRQFRADEAGAREALEQATKESPDFAAAHLQLALLLEQTKEYVRATERYAEVVRLQPTNAVALNNLAYNLAIHQNKLAEAVPFARRAWTLAPTNVNIVDTLAWIHHLQGNSAEAARLLRLLVQRDTGLAEVHLHAAIVFAAVGDLREAERQLGVALKRDPALAETANVRDLRGRLHKR